MRKKLNIENIVNELEEGSVFFRRPKPATPPPQSAIEPRHDGQNVGIEESRRIGGLDSRNIGNEENRKVGKQESELFQLDEVAYRKDSFFFTDAEFNAVVDLKLKLQRKY